MGLSSEQASADGFLDWSQDLFKAASGPARSGNTNNQQQRQPALKCPRCESMNTKFCYYNNYSRSQPRYLCKACRRHWTEGGTLRNVPVGGGRKNKRLKTTHNATDAAAGTTTSDPYLVSQQQQPTSLSLIGDHSNEIFPSIHQMLLHPSEYGMATDFMGSSLVSSNAPFSSQFNDAMNIPFSTTVTPSSPSSMFKFMKPLAKENLKTTSITSTPSLWKLEQPPSSSLPVNMSGVTALDSSSSSGYWNCWDDDIAEFITPATENSKI